MDEKQWGNKKKNTICYAKKKKESIIYAKIQRVESGEAVVCLGSSTAMQACAMVGLEEEGKERKKEKDYTVRKCELQQGGGERGMHGDGSGSWSICPSVS